MTGSPGLIDPVRAKKRLQRSVSATTSNVLWGRAAGRCQFAGCNDVLWRSQVTQEGMNRAERAHIYSFSPDGPRGNAGISEEDIDGADNLMLLCPTCHRKIDRRRDGGRYSVEILRGMKASHERRIEIATSVAPEMSSHVVLFGANVGDHTSPLNFREAAAALFPLRYPAEPTAIQLSTARSSFLDRDPSFWITEEMNLRRKFDKRIRERVADGEIKHLSAFGLAPQPLLILWGTLLGDIVPADVFQRHREPPTWTWPEATDALVDFEVRCPTKATGPVALVLGVSARVTTDRVHRVLGAGARIWTLDLPVPHNDVIKSRLQLSRLRTTLRVLLDRIKTACGQSTLLHIFPAAPVSVAVELGRIRMPKADMPWRIYDQVNELGGFVPALSIPNQQGEQQ